MAGLEKFGIMFFYSGISEKLVQGTHAGEKFPNFT